MFQLLSAMHDAAVAHTVTSLLHQTALLVQNPVTSLAWQVANLQLLVPLVSLTIGTSHFCEPLLRTRAVLVFASSYSVWSYLSVLTRTPQHFNPLRLYNFSQSFRFQFSGVAAAGTVLYIVMVHAWRRMLQIYEQRRLHSG